jgi:hypothetical protein
VADHRAIMGAVLGHDAVLAIGLLNRAIDTLEPDRDRQAMGGIAVESEVRLATGAAG